jgi:hypothetical protein
LWHRVSGRVRPPLRRAARLLSLAACPAVLAVLVADAAAVSPADAYYQSYDCESFVGQPTCNQTAGSWYTLTAVRGTNWDVSNDVCVAWGNLRSQTEQCASLGSDWTISCRSATYGYGWAGTQDGADWNISGHEDDYSGCS